MEKTLEGIKTSQRELSAKASARSVKIKELEQRIRGLESMLYEAQNAALTNRSNFEDVREQRDEARRGKDAAYTERNQLVALLACLYPSWKGVDEKLEGTPFETVVYIDLPTGQVSFHVPDRDIEFFNHVDSNQYRAWDGHATSEKFERIRRFITQTVTNKLVNEWKPPKLTDRQDIDF